MIPGPGGPTDGRSAAGAHPALDWKVTRHGRRLAFMALAGLALALATGRPQFVGLAAPAVVLLCVSWGQRPPACQIEVVPSSLTVTEGEQVDLDLRLGGVEGYEAMVRSRLVPGAEGVVGMATTDGGQARLSIRMSVWGRRSPGRVELVLSDRYGIYGAQASVPLPRVTCYPAPATLRSTPVLGRLVARAGDHASRAAGEGLEFATVREYVPGDRQRSINWAATTRRGRLQVNTFNAERPQDLVLLVDGTADVGELGVSSLDHAVRGAMGVARSYLATRDRVGMVFRGSRMRWVAPGIGGRQLVRLMEAVFEGRSGWSSGDDITRLPRAALPPGASVIAFSPLLSAGFVETLNDLRERRFAVLVVDVLTESPGFSHRGVSQLASRRLRRTARADRVARRLWDLQRHALLYSLGQLGIGVIRWDGRSQLVLPIRQPGASGPGAKR